MHRLSRMAILPIVAVGIAIIWIGAAAAAGPVSITQDKAIAGGVTSGDGPGFPILITDPGSYRLDSDLYPGNVPYGIYISSPNITLDFNGFRMVGASQATDGILVDNIGATISNGTITQFRRHGIFGIVAYYLTVDRMKIEGIGGLRGSAVRCGKYCVVRDSTIIGNNGGIDNNPWSHHDLDDGNTPLFVVGSTVARNSDFQIRTTAGLVLGNVLSGASPGGGDPAWVGSGNNTIDGGRGGASPLTPNFCGRSFGQPLC